MSNSKKKILFLMSGSIACYKACSLISLLIKNQYQVRVVASTSALKFVGEATLEGLTGEKVYSDLWEKGHAMDHINLERWADLIIAAPASAHFINRCASGIGDDLLTTLFLAHTFDKPFLIAPAMNTAMYLNPVTQNSLKTLQSLGLHILETASGVLACGETGYGRLLEPDQMFEAIQSHFNSVNNSSQVPSASKTSHQKPENKTSTSVDAVYASIQSGLPKILITAGGTREHIDNVRYLSNSSTGQTGYEMASWFSQLGFKVTLDLAQSSHYSPDGSYKSERFDDFSSLASLLKRQLSEENFDWIFHAAAISDFSIEKKAGKLSSDDSLTLELKRNPKLIHQIKNWSRNKNIKLVGFKLTSEANSEQVKQKVFRLSAESQSDFVVQNDTATLSDRSLHKFHIYENEQVHSVTGVNQLIQYFSKKMGDQK